MFHVLSEFTPHVLTFLRKVDYRLHVPPFVSGVVSLLSITEACTALMSNVTERGSHDAIIRNEVSRGASIVRIINLETRFCPPTHPSSSPLSLTINAGNSSSPKSSICSCVVYVTTTFGRLWLAELLQLMRPISYCNCFIIPSRRDLFTRRCFSPLCPSSCKLGFARISKKTPDPKRIASTTTSETPSSASCANSCSAESIIPALTAKGSLTLSIIILGVVSFTPPSVKGAFAIAFFSLNKFKCAPGATYRCEKMQ